MNQHIEPGPLPRIEQYRENVDLIALDGKKIYLVGTAHVSRASTLLVEEVIREVRPDAVAIELCDSRYQSLKDPNRWRNTDIVEVIRSGRTQLLLAQLVIAAFQKKLGSQLNVKPGEEMLQAAALAEELKVPVVLADRDIKTTLKRTLSSLRWWTMVRVFSSLIVSIFSGEKIQEHDIERLKSADALEELLKEFTKELPEVRKSLVDERDQYLAGKIAAAPAATLVAVVGAGHVPGIRNWIGRQLDLPALETIPPKTWLRRSLPWILPALIVALLAYGFIGAGTETGKEMMKSWVLITGFSAGLGSLLALAHPFTILASALAAPITAIHPLIASGWVAGLVEAMLRKPQVADFESVADDIGSVRGIYRNRLSRILLIIILTNLLGAAGAVYGWWVLAHIL